MELKAPDKSLNQALNKAGISQYTALILFEGLFRSSDPTHSFLLKERIIRQASVAINNWNEVKRLFPGTQSSQLAKSLADSNTNLLESLVKVLREEYKENA